MPSASARTKTPRLCQCIGCGCDDEHACQDLIGDPCGWLVRSTSGRLGVCTQCPALLRAWEDGKRHFTERAKSAIAERKLLDWASRRRRV
jgi:hypothetical protein